jgi:hypothetical protein
MPTGDFGRYFLEGPSPLQCGSARRCGVVNITRIISTGLRDPDHGAFRQLASAHRMPHARLHASIGMDLLQVRDNLGHSSIVIANIYLHTENEKRHRDTVEHQRMKWDITQEWAAAGARQGARFT